MDSEEQVLPKFTAAKTIVEVSGVLQKSTDLLGQVRAPIAEVVVILAKVDNSLQDAESVFGIIDHVAKIISEALQLTKYLAQVIPEVGPILAKIAGAIENFKIEKILQRISHELKTIIHRVRNGILKEVKGLASTVSLHLETVLNELPGWNTTIGMMANLYMIIEILFSNTSSELIAQVLKTFNETTGGSLDKIKDIQNSLGPVKDFIKDKWDVVKDAILKPIQDSFESLKTTLQPITDVINTCIGICNKVKEVFQPVFCILEVISWIFDNTIGRLVEWVKQALHLDEFVERCIRTITKELGLDKVKDNLQRILDSALELIHEPLKSITRGDLTTSVKEFGRDLQSFRRDPINHLLTVITKDLYSEEIRRINPEKRREKKKKKRLALLKEEKDITLTLQRVSDSMFDDPSQDPDAYRVEKVQERMDEFVKHTAGAESVAPTISLCSLAVPPANVGKSPPVSQPISSAPKLAYAFHDNQPVSVVIRLSHDRVLDQQHDARTKELAPMTTPPQVLSAMFSTTLFTVGTGSNDLVAPPSDGGRKIPNFDSYSTKCNELLNEIQVASVYLFKLEDATRQADSDFATHKSEAADFPDHLISMLDGLDPILNASANLLSLPLKYSTTITEALVKVLKNNGLGDTFASAVSEMFKTIGQVSDVIEELRGSKKQMQDDYRKVSETYRTFCGHVGQICSYGYIPKTLGSIASLSAVIPVLQRRLNSSAKCFKFLKDLGDTVISNQEKLGGDADEILTKLGGVYANVNPVLDSTLKDIQSLPGQVNNLYDALDVVRKDVQVFFNASHTISKQCRHVEAKVIATDMARSWCIRINAAMEPFDSLLHQFGVRIAENRMVTVPADLPDDGQPVNFSQLLSIIVPEGLNMLLDNFFRLKDFDNEIVEVGKKFQKPAIETSFANFKIALQQLFDTVEPKNLNTYSPRSDLDTGKPAGPAFLVLNPVLDEPTAQSLQSILREISDKHGIVVEQHAEITYDTIRIPEWAKTGQVDLKSIQDVNLLFWSRKWDALEPDHPSEVFLRWYELLERLDSTVKGRQSWQRTDTSAPLSYTAPATLAADSAKALWTILEEKAIVGANLYGTEIKMPLQKPLHDRIHQLIRGTVRLPPESMDILRLLTSPKKPSKGENNTVPLAAVYYALPAPAFNLVESAFEDGKIPADLKAVIEGQREFVDVANQLGPLICGADNDKTTVAVPGYSATKSLGALSALYGDSSLMDARKMLELTGNEVEVREFVKIAGCEERIRVEG